jgi:dihydrofolate reductase
MENDSNLTKKSTVSIVVAVTRKNAAIGNGKELLFRISDDLKRFRDVTMGHPLIFGRKTYESIGKPLPGRTNIVVTRNTDFKAEGCIVAPSLDEAIEKASKIDNEIFIGGGGEIYKKAFPIANKLYLTVVDSDAEGNIFFPDWTKDFTKEISREERYDEKTGLKYTWFDLERES